MQRCDHVCLTPWMMIWHLRVCPETRKGHVECLERKPVHQLSVAGHVAQICRRLSIGAVGNKHSMPSSPVTAQPIKRSRLVRRRGSETCDELKQSPAPDSSESSDILISPAELEQLKCGTISFSTDEIHNHASYMHKDVKCVPQGPVCPDSHAGYFTTPQIDTRMTTHALQASASNHQPPTLDTWKYSLRSSGCSQQSWSEDLARAPTLQGSFSSGTTDELRFVSPHAAKASFVQDFDHVGENHSTGFVDPKLTWLSDSAITSSPTDIAVRANSPSSWRSQPLENHELCASEFLGDKVEAATTVLSHDSTTRRNAHVYSSQTTAGPRESSRILRLPTVSPSQMGIRTQAGQALVSQRSSIWADAPPSPSCHVPSLSHPYEVPGHETPGRPRLEKASYANNVRPALAQTTGSNAARIDVQLVSTEAHISATDDISMIAAANKCPHPNCKFMAKGRKNRLTHFKRHMEIHKKPPKIPCHFPGCKSSFAANRRDNLQAHLRRVHHQQDTAMYTLATRGPYAISRKSSYTATAASQTVQGFELGDFDDLEVEAEPGIPGAAGDGLEDGQWHLLDGLLFERDKRGTALDGVQGLSDGTLAVGDLQDELDITGERPEGLPATAWRDYNGPEWT